MGLGDIWLWCRLTWALCLLTWAHATSASRYLAELCGVGAALPGSSGGEPETAFPTVSSGLLLSVAPVVGLLPGVSPALCALKPLPVLCPGSEAAVLPVPGGSG